MPQRKMGHILFFCKAANPYELFGRPILHMGHPFACPAARDGKAPPSEKPPAGGLSFTHRPSLDGDALLLRQLGLAGLGEGQAQDAVLEGGGDILGADVTHIEAP